MQSSKLKMQNGERRSRHSTRRFFFALHFAFCIFNFALPAPAGTITATLKSEEPVTKAVAVQRTHTKTGTSFKPFAGKVDGDKVTFADLPSPSVYELNFETASGLVMGWDATTPASDYEEEQPLSDEARATIIRKMSKDNAVGFPDQAQIIDLQGNIQNAVVIINTLRTTPFAESVGTNTTTWIWRVDRWQWHDPNEQTWEPLFERPYYSVIRQRIPAGTYAAKSVAFARHLGSIALTAEKPEVDLGIIIVPKPEPGVRAVNPDGSTIKPIVIKPKPAGNAAAAEPQGKADPAAPAVKE